MKSESTSILERFNQSEPADAAYHPDGDYKAFGVSRHAVSLNLIQRDASQVGISWSLFSDASFDPAKGIVVEFSHKVVRIEGSRLLQLYQYILGNRVTFIAEADRATHKLCIQSEEPVVSKLLVQARRET